MITIIVAVGHDGAIGRRGDLAFHISADLKHFKALTTGHTVIMGRRTFESLPNGALPNRRNIVVTRNETYSAPNIETASSLHDALNLASQQNSTDSPDNEIFIIGGGEIYRQALDLADRLEITEIDADCPGADTFFPTIEASTWAPASETPPFTIDPKSGHSYRFITYVRK